MKTPSKELIDQLEQYLGEQAEYLAPLPIQSLENSFLSDGGQPKQEAELIIIATKSDNFITEITRSDDSNEGLSMLQKLLIALNKDLENVHVHITNHPLSKDKQLYVTEDDLNAVRKVIETINSPWILILDESLGRLLVHQLGDQEVGISQLNMGDVYSILGQKSIFTHSISLLLKQTHHKRATWTHVQPLLVDS